MCVCTDGDGFPWGYNAEGLSGALEPGRPGCKALFHQLYVPNGAWVIMGGNLLSHTAQGWQPSLLIYAPLREIEAINGSVRKYTRQVAG